MMLSQQIMKHIKKGQLILQMGCGTGEIAKQLIKAGYTEYVGFDKSEKKIRKCNKLKKIYKAWSYCFFQSDYKSLDLMYCKTDILIVSDFLEYQEDDIDIVKKATKGIKLIITLSSRLKKNMLRAFDGKKEIEERYGKYIKILKIDDDKDYYILVGVKK